MDSGFPCAENRDMTGPHDWDEPLFSEQELPPKAGRERPRRKKKSAQERLWTSSKARLIERYLNLFVLITKDGTYIDAFAGPQEVDDDQRRLGDRSEPVDGRRAVERRVVGNRRWLLGPLLQGTIGGARASIEAEPVGRSVREPAATRDRCPEPSP